VLLDLVPVAATFSVLADVTSLGQIVHNVIGPPFGDAEVRGDIAQTSVSITGDAK
jgi:hypothetical protein